MRSKDESYFAPFFTGYPDLYICNAAAGPIVLDEMDGLLLTGGADIAPSFLNQPVPDPSLIDRECDPSRDAWELGAIKGALARNLPILAICKGMQVLNVALGGTLHLNITGHNLPSQKDHDLQPLRFDKTARHRFDKVNSSHHQALDRLGDGLVVEAWCATDDVIEQTRLRGYRFALAVQYHPERGSIYGALFRDFISHLPPPASSKIPSS